ncbi:uncharacterized protein TM35_000151050 [Trypanosoma theileri]|uniref:Mucin-associated surface protein (MASP) n=1 Tax=Trypanosoma theileri TaxID=67003 RepID=A0A1X0NVD5_9TRYP|nr:uncharacterized protein TM35_000151050 [Trypanosoma theileri]ORC88674.1 hypothetical protein TM35_000151050 [Trypanosoma theileri]
MMMIMRRVMCVLAVVLCCACGYTMAAAAAVDNDSPSGRGVSRGAVEVSCGAGGALRVRPAAESEWLTCGAGSRVSACGKYADLCRQRTARTATTTTIDTAAPGQPKAVMAEFYGSYDTALLKEEWDKKQKEKDLLKQQELDKQKVTAPTQTPERLQPENHLNEETNGDLRNQNSDSPPSPEVKRPEGRDPPVAAAAEVAVGHQGDRSMGGKGMGSEPQGVVTEDPAIVTEDAERKPDTGATTTLGKTPESNGAAESDQGALGSTADNTSPGTSNATNQSQAADTTAPNSTSATADSQETTSTTPPSTENTTTEASTATTSPVPVTNAEINTVPGDSTTQQPSSEGTTTVQDSEETNTATPSTDNTLSEAPSTTPSPAPVTNPQISSNIASTVQKNKANVDSSVNPVWMRTTASLLIVTVLVSATVY